MSSVAHTFQRSLQLDLAGFLRSRWLWCFAAVAFCLVRALGSNLGGLRETLGDTDDATRLLQVRELIAGAGWFDLTLPRFGGDTPLVSHWSRLIDVPLMLLLLTFQFFFDPATAELLVRIVWPTLLLLVFLRLMLREVEFRTDAFGAGFFLAIGVSCFSGLFQFNIGRIDHHNVMIACAVVGSLALLRIRTHRSAAIEAGALLALSLAVGFEALAIVLPLLAVAGLAALLQSDLRVDLARFGLTFAAVTIGIFVLTVAPSQWLAAKCDALSSNTAVLALSGAAGLWLLARGPLTMPLWQAAALMTAPVVAGLGIYAALDPKCLAGPFGQVDPGIKLLWLDTVFETFNVFRLATRNPLAAAVFAFTQTFGLVAAVYVLKRGDGDTLFRRGLLFLLVLSTLGGMWQSKLIPYSAWFSVFALVVAIASFRDGVQMSKLSMQLLTALIVNQSVIGLVAVRALKAGGASDDLIQTKSLGDTNICRSTSAVSALNSMPPGLIVAPVDLGPYAVALTPHRVLAAPYHRIGGSIIASYNILGDDKALAEQRLRKTGADYLVLCLPDKALEDPNAVILKGDGLQEFLLTGGTVPYLEAVKLPAAAKTIKAWKVLPQS